MTVSAAFACAANSAKTAHAATEILIFHLYPFVEVLKYLFLYLNKPMLHLVTLICNLSVIYFLNLINLCLLYRHLGLNFILVKIERIKRYESTKFESGIAR